MKSDTICWKCANTKCAWASKCKPVDGWTAEQFEYRLQTRKDISYVVYSCPEFKEEKTAPKANTVLIEAIVKSIVRDFKYLYVWEIVHPNKQNEFELNNLEIGIMTEIFTDERIKMIFRKLKKEVETEIAILFDWKRCKTEKEKQELYDKYGKETVESIRRKYSRHPAFMKRH